jgi:hypothetical protein
MCGLPVYVTVGTVFAREKGHPADARQRLECFPIEDVAGRGVRGLDQWSLGGDSNRFFDGADFEHDVERQELLRRDPRVLLLERLESGDRRPDRVHARHQARERVLADVVARRVARDAVILIDQRDRCAGNHALRVLDRAAQPALEGLSGAGPGDEAHHERGKYHACVSHTPPCYGRLNLQASLKGSPY